MSDLEKAISLPDDVDPTHTYVYRSTEYGDFYQYWYQDRAGNYWRYTNAPEDSPDHDPYGGEPLLDPNQPTQVEAPQFFTPQGFKRNIALPEGSVAVPNEQYTELSPKYVWFEKYQDEQGNTRYIYLDKDIKESIDLYLQQQIRIVDAGIVNYRKFSSNLFQSAHPRDRVTAAILILVDQCLFGVDELISATKGDLVFADKTINLLGRTFIPDEFMLDFFTTLGVDKHDSEPLFHFSTVHGDNPVGSETINATFAFLKVSPKYMCMWHATQMFSSIMGRMAAQHVPAEEAVDLAFEELSRVLASTKDVRYLVDARVRDTVIQNYEKFVAKAIVRVETGAYGIPTILSDLVDRKVDEKQFSNWLHAQPMHDISEEEQAEIDREIQGEEEAEQADGAPQPAEEPAEDAPQPAPVEDEDAPAVEPPKEPDEQSV